MSREAQIILKNIKQSSSLMKSRKTFQYYFPIQLKSYKVVVEKLTLLHAFECSKRIKSKQMSSKTLRFRDETRSPIHRNKTLPQEASRD